MREGPFGLRWFWPGVVAILAITTVALFSIVFVQRAAYDRAAAAQAASYTPPPFTGAPEQPLVAFIGDSYTAGTGATSGKTTFVSRLVSAEQWRYKNFANGGTGYITTATDGERACGQASCPAYSDVISDVTAISPDMVVVTGGRNDLEHTSAELRAGVPTFFEDLRKALPKTKIVVVSPIWDDGPAPAALTDLQKIVQSASTEVDATYLDIGEPLRGKKIDVIADGVHPSVAGHDAIAKAIEAALK